MWAQIKNITPIVDTKEINRKIQKSKFKKNNFFGSTQIFGLNSNTTEKLLISVEKKITKIKKK